ncbi:MAG TPA: hypothetical protein DCX06_05660 [Opitutae bacterium]|mgnify:CR=1 FL=1|nr:hypothetical protein [Opitutae bacterium]
MNKQKAIGQWIIWFVFLQSALVIHFVLGGGFPEGDNATEPMAAVVWAACIAPILIATGIRWLVIPKLQDPSKLFIAMILGLVLSEQPIFISLFLIGDEYPQNQIAVLMVSVMSLIQLAPSYLTPGYKLDSEV